MAAEIKKSWYKEMVVYQIWPRSFCDGNGDGIGDLKGILSKLDHIKSLGVDAIGSHPLQVSPKDYGYDVADYRTLPPNTALLRNSSLFWKRHTKGHQGHYGPCHKPTSDQHYWFLESKKGEDNPYHDYYFWRKEDWAASSRLTTGSPFSPNRLEVTKILINGICTCLPPSSPTEHG